MGTHTLNKHDLEDEIKIEFDFFSLSFKNVKSDHLLLARSLHVSGQAQLPHFLI